MAFPYRPHPGTLPTPQQPMMPQGMPQGMPEPMPPMPPKKPAAQMKKAANRGALLKQMKGAC